MNRLLPETQRRIMAALTYTDVQREQIRATRSICFHIDGCTQNFPIDPLRYSTVEGICAQLDDFVECHGILYIVDPWTMNIDEYCVAIDRESFFSQPHIQKLIKYKFAF